METVGKRKPRRRRSFTSEFKAEIVDACNRGDRSIGQVARDFDLTEMAVREWVKQADIDPGLRRAVFGYVEGWYNTRRLHGSLATAAPPSTKRPSTRRPRPGRHDQQTSPVRQTGLDMSAE